MMKTSHIAFRLAAILFALSPVSGAMAQDGVAPAESAPMVVAQLSQGGDDSRPATQGDIRSMGERIGGLEGRISGLEDRMGKLEGRISGLEGRMGRLEERISGLEDRMGKLEEHMGQMRADMREIRGAMRENFRWLLAAIIALLGLPHFPGWVNRLRGNGKASAAS